MCKSTLIPSHLSTQISFIAMEGTHEHSPEPPSELSPDMEPSLHSHGPLRLSTTWPADTNLWNNERVTMSTIWRELPIELVQKIFNHHIEDFINKCFFQRRMRV